MSNNNNNNGSNLISKIFIAAICVIAARTEPNLSQHAKQIAIDEPHLFEVLNRSKVTTNTDSYHDCFIFSYVTMPNTEAWVSVGIFGVVYVFQEAAHKQLPNIRTQDSDPITKNINSSELGSN